MIPVPPSKAIPTAAIAIVVEVPLEEPLPPARFDDPGDGLRPGAPDPDPVGGGETDGEPVGEELGEVDGATVGLDFRRTTTRPHIPQSGKRASAPWIWQWYTNTPRLWNECEKERPG